MSELMSQTPLALLARRIRTRRRAPMLVLAALAATAAAVLTAAAPASAVLRSSWG